jgi:uncharacterized protein (TIGR02271 family)
MTEDEPDRAIPLYQEQLHVTKAEVVTDRVRVTTSTDERAVTIEDTLERGHLRVERIAVERAVAQAPEPRQDGDTLIISVVEERLVVEKRLFVVEELHITRTSITERVSIPETVRTMHATVGRAEPAQSTGRDNDG